MDGHEKGQKEEAGGKHEKGWGLSQAEILRSERDISSKSQKNARRLRGK